MEARSRILIIEDTMITAKYIDMVVRRMGFEVVGIGGSADEALRLVEEKRPGLVLMDIRLKGEPDGVEAARLIKDNYDIPVVFLTAYTDDATLFRAKDCEPYGYVVKPFEERELYSTITMAFQKYATDRQIQAYQQWLAAILNGITDGVIAMDEKGFIKFMNPVAETLTGYTEKDVLSQKIENVYAPINSETGENHFIYQHSPEDGRLRSGNAINLLLTTPQNLTFYIDESVSPLLDERGKYKGSVIVIRDLTERITIRQQLRLLESAVMDSKDPIIISKNGDIQGNNKAKSIIVFVNPAYLIFTGYKPEDVIGKELEIIPVRNESDQLLYEKYIDELEKNGFLSLEATYYKKNGEPYIADCRFSGSWDRNGNIINWILIQRDITEKRKMEREIARQKEEQERVVLSAIVEAQEKERVRFALDIHDGLGLNLSALKMFLSNIESKISEKSPDIKNALENCIKLADEVVSESRKISRNLTPSVLQDFDLATALDHLCGIVKQMGVMEVRFNVYNANVGHVLKKSMEIGIYRVVQEIFQNAIKHSRARVLVMQLTFLEDWLALTIEDDGVGFLPDDVKKSGVTGLQNIETRIKILNGVFTIESRPNKGSLFLIEIPLKPLTILNTISS